MARPRSEEANRAALDTTVELLLEGGTEAVTVEEVAARSGVAKSTIYRHFQSRENLIAAAARGCVVEHPTPDTGTLDSDLRWLFARFSISEGEQRLNRLLPLLIDVGRRDPEARALVTDLVDHRKQPIRRALQQAQLRGEISEDLDLDVAYAMLIGPFTFRRLVEQVEVTPEFVEAVLSGSITALRATAPV